MTYLNLQRFWTGPLPQEELFPSRQVNPFLHWFIHPIKRHLAKYYLAFLQKFWGLKVIALTGSAGKTTTSNMLYSILSLVSPTIKTADSTTSTYNIPTTILKCTPKTKYLILEMGVEYKGDMDFYCWLAKPDIGLFLNVSPVHSSFIGSLKDIKTEKIKLLKYAKIPIQPTNFPKILSSEITPDLKTKILLGQLEINLPLLGTHLSQNTAAVVAVCQYLNIPLQIIKQGLESVSSPLHRMNVTKLKNGNIILDDSYNANPLSVTEALKTLSLVSNAQSLVPVFVFGQMNELGRYEKSEHAKIGLEIRKLGIRNFFCIGPATKLTIKSAGFGQYFESLESLTTEVKLKTKNLKLVILIKGSHSWHLEKLCDIIGLA